MASLLNAPPRVAEPALMNWFMQVFRVCVNASNSGTTAQRPTTGFYEGMDYTDLTLNKKVWYINGTWRDATGAPA